MLVIILVFRHPNPVQIIVLGILVGQRFYCPITIPIGTAIVTINDGFVDDGVVICSIFLMVKGLLILLVVMVMLLVMILFNNNISFCFNGIHVSSPPPTNFLIILLVIRSPKYFYTILYRLEIIYIYINKTS